MRATYNSENKHLFNEAGQAISKVLAPLVGYDFIYRDIFKNQERAQVGDTGATIVTPEWVIRTSAYLTHDHGYYTSYLFNVIPLHYFIDSFRQSEHPYSPDGHFTQEVIQDALWIGSTKEPNRGCFYINDGYTMHHPLGYIVYNAQESLEDLNQSINRIKEADLSRKLYLQAYHDKSYAYWGEDFEVLAQGAESIKYRIESKMTKEQYLQALLDISRGGQS